MPKTNELIEFDASTSNDDLDGYIKDYMWDFGDGKTGKEQIVYHNYSQAGSYTVKLTVTDDKGAKGLFNLTVCVDKPHIPISNLLEIIGIVVTVIGLFIGANWFRGRRNRRDGNNAKEPEGGAEKENSEDNREA